MEIYNKVQREFSKFNSDLSQLGCELSDKYVKSIFTVLVSIVSKITLDRKVQDEKDMIVEKEKIKKSYQDNAKEKSQRSNDKEHNDFVDKLTTSYKEMMSTRKKELM